MVPDTNDEKIRPDERAVKAPVKPVDHEIDNHTIYNTPYQLPATGLEKIEVYPY